MRVRSLLFSFAWCALSASATTLPAEKHPGMRALAEEAAAGDPARAAQVLELLERANYQQGIIDAIARPAEVRPWHQYRPIFIAEERIEQGVQFWQRHREWLERVEAHYQVPARVIVAIIGVETSYGRNVGRWKVLDALTTLGLYYPPRQSYFRGELLRYLTLDERPDIRFDRLNAVGSYAGAMGLGQFMPTSYAKWAVDFDQDGQIDLWNSSADVLASVANYLKEHGWRPDEPVLIPLVARADAVDLGPNRIELNRTLAELRDFGYEPADRVVDPNAPRFGLWPIPLPPDTRTNLLVLDGAQGPEYFAIFDNFYVITRYNRSPLYAMAVYELSELIEGRWAQR